PRPSRASARHATTCPTPGGIVWSHPGQRYGLTAPAPGTARTIHSPSGPSSVSWAHGAPPRRGGGPNAARRFLRGLMLRAYSAERPPGRHVLGEKGHGREGGLAGLRVERAQDGDGAVQAEA